MKKLKGSESQIKWAEEIRKEYLIDVEDFKIMVEREDPLLVKTLIYVYEYEKEAARYQTTTNRLFKLAYDDKIWDLYRKYNCSEEDEYKILKGTLEWDAFCERRKRANKELIDWAFKKIEEKLEDDSAANWINNRVNEKNSKFRYIGVSEDKIDFPEECLSFVTIDKETNKKLDEISKYKKIPKSKLFQNMINVEYSKLKNKI